MSATIKTYFLVPGWDFPPGSIPLGSILLSPTHPQRSLSTTPPIPIDTPIHSTTKSHFATTLSKSNHRKLGLWAQFLQIFGLGTELSLQYDKNQIDSYSFETMTTSFFIPSNSFVQNSLSAPAVCEVLEQMDFRKPIYIITALKTVEGASVTTVRGKGRKVHGKLGVDGTAALVPVSVGPEGDWGSREEERVTFRSESAVVFAYQLTRVGFKGKGEKGFEQKAYTKGALFGTDDEQVDGELGMFEVERSWGVGEGGDVVEVVEEDDEEEGECYCVIPEGAII